MTLAGSAGEKPGLDHQYQSGADDEDEPLHLEADLGDPVEERDGPPAVRSEGGAVDGEHGRPGLRSLERAQPEEEIGEVPENDDDHDLDEGQTEGHQDAAVDEVLHLDAGAGPHAEDVPGSGPTFAGRDEIHAVLFDVERLRRLRVVNDRQILRDCHRAASLVFPRGPAPVPRVTAHCWVRRPASSETP